MSDATVTKLALREMPFYDYFHHVDDFHSEVNCFKRFVISYFHFPYCRWFELSSNIRIPLIARLKDNWYGYAGFSLDCVRRIRSKQESAGSGWLFLEYEDGFITIHFNADFEVTAVRFELTGVRVVLQNSLPNEMIDLIYEHLMPLPISQLSSVIGQPAIQSFQDYQ